jgi:hypothetical protein
MKVIIARFPLPRFSDHVPLPQYMGSLVLITINVACLLWHGTASVLLLTAF